MRAAARSGEGAATRPADAPGYMAEAALAFTEHFERVGEVAAVVLVGGMLVAVTPSWAMLWFVPFLLLAIRPAAVLAGLAGSRTARQRVLAGWFGMRGVGSVYYLAYAVTHGVPADLAGTLAALTLATMAASIAAHGASVTPLMARYESGERPAAAPDPA